MKFLYFSHYLTSTQSVRLSASMNISVRVSEGDLQFSFENDTIAVNQNFPWTPINLTIFITNMVAVASVNVMSMVSIFKKVCSKD